MRKDESLAKLRNAFDMAEAALARMEQDAQTEPGREIAKCMVCGTQCIPDGPRAIHCPKCDASPGRIDILAWRKHGDDESRLYTWAGRCLADPRTAREALARHLHLAFDLDDNEEVPEGKSRAYIVDEHCLRDGMRLQAGGRTFELTIREVSIHDAV